MPFHLRIENPLIFKSLKVQTRSIIDVPMKVSQHILVRFLKYVLKPDPTRHELQINPPKKN